jgi:hypothetical protein
MTNTSEPIATLYIYKRNKRIVAIAVGQAPPGVLVHYDSLTRIPIMTNGDKPPWRTFTHHIGREPLGKALRRRRWPDQEPTPLPPRNRGKRQSPPRRRRSKPKKSHQIGDVITWNGGKYKILAINGNNNIFARHIHTREAINIKLEELEG